MHTSPWGGLTRLPPFDMLCDNSRAAIDPKSLCGWEHRPRSVDPADMYRLDHWRMDSGFMMLSKRGLAGAPGP